MSYQNYSRKSGYTPSYGSGGYSQAPYTQNGWNQRQKSKKSGAKSGVAHVRTTGEAKHWVSGWQVRNRQLTSIMCGPYKDTRESKSKSGRIWHNWIAKIKPAAGAPYIQPCLYDAMTGKVIIRSLGMVINPKAPNGGYCGTYKQTSNSNRRNYR